MKKEYLLILILILMCSLSLFSCNADNSVQNDDDTASNERPSNDNDICQHDWKEWETIKPVTCTKNGEKIRMCSKCGENEIEAIIASGHKFIDWIITIEPTCSTEGEKTRLCQICDYLETQNIPINGYDDNGICLHCGFTNPTYFTFALLDDATYSISARDENGMPAVVMIPNTYNGLPISTIDGKAFKNCSNLVSITIPDSVVNICEGAFSGCSSLEKISLPFAGNMVNTPSCIYWYPFGYIFGTLEYQKSYKTTQTIYQYYNGATEIFNSSITYYLPSNLKTVTITNGNIQRAAFQNCSKLTNIVLGDNVTNIYDEAFKYCSSLKSVIIGDSVSSIGNSAFYDCGSLVDIYIPDNVSSIGNHAFDSCGKLCNVIFGNNSKITVIGQYTFAHSGLTQINIPNSVTIIGYGAFRWCFDLVNITIPNNVTVIGEDAFEMCLSLESITLPNSVVTIDSHAFEACYLLSSVYYLGTPNEWNQIDISSYQNNYLIKANRYYYSETEPLSSGDFWHYGENGEIVIWN